MNHLRIVNFLPAARDRDGGEGGFNVAYDYRHRRAPEARGSQWAREAKRGFYSTNRAVELARHPEGHSSVQEKEKGV